MLNRFKIILGMLLLAVVSTYAQKLPSKQNKSLRTPDNITIDGRAIEFKEQYQAYNNSTDLYYTIANNDEYLYLIVHANKPRIIQKLLSVGVTFTVNKNGEKSNKSKQNTTLTYPQIDAALIGKLLTDLNIRSADIVKGLNDTAKNNSISRLKQDSMLNDANRLLTNNSKTIGVAGISEISDSTISVYNEEKIHVANMFDKNGEYTCEFSIPLKYFGLSVKGTQKFNYNIKLTGRQEHMKKGFLAIYRYNNTGEGYDINADLNSTTDFWDEYELAKP